MKRGKKGQQVFGLSFGAIFAILMSVVFIVLAFIAINYFLDIGECAQVEGFYEDLQKEVDTTYGMYERKSKFDINLPSEIKEVCFGNISRSDFNDADYEEVYDYGDEGSNIFLVPIDHTCEMYSKSIKHLDVEEIIDESGVNPTCFDAGGRLIIKISPGEDVTVE